MKINQEQIETLYVLFRDTDSNAKIRLSNNGNNVVVAYQNNRNWYATINKRGIVKIHDTNHK